ncbi:MAG: divalent-cation tolerance protein CutA [Candidatus Omnitrophota bacterium]
MCIVVLVTAPSVSCAKKISGFLLKKRLVACVNIVNKLESFFWWQGKIDKAKEALLIIKTKKRLIKELIKAVKSKHPYSVPEIIALPIISGSKDYLDWIDESCR